MMLREDSFLTAAAELLCPSLFASLTVCLTGKLLMPALKKKILWHKTIIDTKPKIQKIYRRYGIHYGRDAIFGKHWSCKQVYYSKKWVVGHFLLPHLFLPFMSLPA